VGDDELRVAGDADQNGVARDGNFHHLLARKLEIRRQQDLIQAGGAAAQAQQLADVVRLDLPLQNVAQVVGAADHGVHAQSVEQAPVFGVGGPGHGAVHAKLLLGDLAGHEVVLVRAGHGHKGVAAGHVGGAQGVGADGVPADDRDVQRIGQHPALSLHRLNDDHLVAVGQQILGQIPPHPAAACNTNFHINTSYYRM